MARTALPPLEWVANGSVDEPTGVTADPTNNHVVDISGFGTDRLLLAVDITTTDRVVTIKAGDQPPAIAAGQGDLAVTCTAGTRKWIGPVESGRFAQNDGTLEIDLAASSTGTLTAYKVPRAV